MSEAHVGDDWEPSKAQEAVTGTLPMAKVPKARNSEPHGIDGSQAALSPGFPCLFPARPACFRQGYVSHDPVATYSAICMPGIFW